MKTIQQEIECGLANRIAARYNERYCKAMAAIKDAHNSKKPSLKTEMEKEADFIADLFDDYKTECEKMGIDISVELDYENWEEGE